MDVEKLDVLVLSLVLLVQFGEKGLLGYWDSDLLWPSGLRVAGRSLAYNPTTPMLPAPYR